VLFGDFDGPVKVMHFAVHLCRRSSWPCSVGVRRRHDFAEGGSAMGRGSEDEGCGRRAVDVEAGGGPVMKPEVD